MAHATTAQVAAELGRPAASQGESDQWQAWLDRVERAIERAFRRAGLDLADEIAAGRVLAADVADVEVDRVVERASRPDWRSTSVTRSIDDMSVTYRNESGTGDPLLLTTDDLELLLPVVTSGAFSTRPGFEPDLPGVEDWS